MSDYIFEILLGSMALLSLTVSAAIIRAGLAQKKEEAKRKREAEARWAKMTPEERATERAMKAAANVRRRSEQRSATAAHIAISMLR